VGAGTPITRCGEVCALPSSRLIALSSFPQRRQPLARHALEPGRRILPDQRLVRFGRPVELSCPSMRLVRLVLAVTHRRSRAGRLPRRPARSSRHRARSLPPHLSGCANPFAQHDT
jgi:hypothetical protein